MDHPDARYLRRALFLTQSILAVLVLLALLLAHAWDSLPIQIGVVAVLLAAHAFLVVRPFGARIERVVGGALRRSEDLRRDVERLNEARAHAEAEVQTKGAFLAAMSHEIRTPMNGVIGMASLLEDSHLDRAQRDFVHTIRSSGNVLLTLINDVLDLSKIEAGEATPDRRPVALRPLVEAAFDLVASRAAAKHVELVYVPAPGVPSHVLTDPTRLRQILVNLLSNAVKHTARGEIVVTTRWERGADTSSGQSGVESAQLQMDVRDTGAGMPESDLAHLFEPYRQGSNPAEGTGLGLHICKQLVHLLGGTISARSLEGVGSTFSFAIDAPRAEAEDAPRPTPSLYGRAVIVVVPNRMLREALVVRLRTWGLETEEAASVEEAEAILEGPGWYHGLLLDLAAPDATNAERLRARYSSLPFIALTSLRRVASTFDADAYLAKPVKDEALQRALLDLLIPESKSAVAERDAVSRSERATQRVLLVEDNPMNQKVALQLLERLGLRADLVTNGREAVEATQRTPYEVVLMDVQMPVMDGVEATRAIRAQEGMHGCRPRIVALTASAMEGDRDYFLSAGMDAYLAKPFSLDALEAVIEGPATHEPEPVPDAARAVAARSHREIAAMFYRTLRMRLAQVVGDDDPTFARDTLESFLASGPRLLDETQEALTRRDLGAARQAVQTLRSSATLLGADSLVKRCRAFEQGALDGTLRFDDAAVHVRALQGLYGNLQHILRTILAEEQVVELHALPQDEPSTIDTQPEKTMVA